MIARRLRRVTDVAATLRYILRADPTRTSRLVWDASWSTARIEVAEPGSDTYSPLTSVPAVVARGVVGTTPEAVTMVFQSLAARGRSDSPFEYLVVSVGRSENLSIGRAYHVARDLLQGLGFAPSHSWIAVVHADSAEIHLHLLVCRVDPETGLAHHPKKIVRTLERTVAFVADMNRLAVVPGRHNREVVARLTGVPVESLPLPPRRRFQRQRPDAPPPAQVLVDGFRAACRRARSADEFHLSLAIEGITVVLKPGPSGGRPAPHLRLGAIEGSPTLALRSREVHAGAQVLAWARTPPSAAVALILPRLPAMALATAASRAAPGGAEPSRPPGRPARPRTVAEVAARNPRQAREARLRVVWEQERVEAWNQHRSGQRGTDKSADDPRSAPVSAAQIAVEMIAAGLANANPSRADLDALRRLRRSVRERGLRAGGPRLRFEFPAYADWRRSLSELDVALLDAPPAPHANRVPSSPTYVYGREKPPLVGLDGRLASDDTRCSVGSAAAACQEALHRFLAAAREVERVNPVGVERYGQLAAVLGDAGQAGTAVLARWATEQAQAGAPYVEPLRDADLHHRDFRRGIAVLLERARRDPSGLSAEDGHTLARSIAAALPLIARIPPIGADDEPARTASALALTSAAKFLEAKFGPVPAPTERSPMPAAPDRAPICRSPGKRGGGRCGEVIEALAAASNRLVRAADDLAVVVPDLYRAAHGESLGGYRPGGSAGDAPRATFRERCARRPPVAATFERFTHELKQLDEASLVAQRGASSRGGYNWDEWKILNDLHRRTRYGVMWVAQLGADTWDLDKQLQLSLGSRRRAPGKEVLARAGRGRARSGAAQQSATTSRGRSAQVKGR
ncbi:relaxase/mobilization nuclease domain-containing protein [Roseomonas sp. SSH11]|uniref:Relaxase/mobilization nuclease domain-containing protein n=1 Tax=Pararoseomonas baculiformis TaxID=2820812 RepID=A0ABS4AKZ2_9PROT|nr:relaxase/mobilization nuclease domain-containing protein [Pararoseomonas baculiformis]MBP0447704.1 relaxase/mobilization nuclease domain-containing protein [Pararoseomonas baculiformis]